MKHLENPSINDMFMQWKLPFHLHKLNERARISIAYASEGCKMLADQCSLSECQYFPCGVQKAALYFFDIVLGLGGTSKLWLCSSLRVDQMRRNAEQRAVL
jgi:hypothetical protein